MARNLANTAYVVIVEPVLAGGALGPKSATLYLETGALLTPPKYQIGTLSTPSGLDFQPGTRVPNPAGGIPGVFFLQWNAVRDVGGYEVFTNPNPRPDMETPGLMAGDRLIAAAAQPATVDSQAPVKVTTDPFSAPGELCNLKVRAFRNVQDGLRAYSAFTAPLVTILPKTSVPDQPTSLRLSAPATQTTVPTTWNTGPASPPVVEFRIYESGRFKMAFQAPAVTAVVGGYTASSPYKIQVTAVNAKGESGPSTVLEGTTAPVVRGE
ncbi:fibronectin type III domain-containing protein [Streptomyces sp. NPDC090036]|uniref:fibronectin type III domain-containing protein n=1 Tax=Streptomyces sp. NPDC090036 TaxID=3365926 RepID=UPI003826BA13